MSEAGCKKLVKQIGKLSFNKCECKECFLGQGGFGDVYRGQFESKVNVAVKRILITRAEVKDDILLNADNHQNILRYYITETDENL